MVKKWIALGSLFAVAAFMIVIVSGIAGCGQQTSTTTTTTIAASSAVAISGTTATGTTALGVRAFAALGTADVKIGYCKASSDEVIPLASGTTTPDGIYEVLVSVASLESLKATNGLVPNLIVTISKEGTVIGCVIPSISPEAGKKAYSPTATQGDHKKALIARAAFKKGQDPKSFDYSSNVDRKFSSESLKDYSAAKIDAVADSIKGAEDSMDEIIAGLGISTATLEAMKLKGLELHQAIIEPIMQSAFSSKTPPNREQMDAAFASMEVEMTKYAIERGLNRQQIADLKSMKDKQFETKMGGQSALSGDAAFGESKRRMSGDKMVSMFLSQWEAAKTLATIAPGVKVTFAASNEPTYLSFVASKETIKTELLRLMSTAGTSPEAIPSYLRTNFFDAFIFPPANADKGTSEADRSNFVKNNASSRILMYFMHTFVSPLDLDTFLRTTQPAMQLVFQNRFSDSNNSSGYYMGPAFWLGNPSDATIQTRLANFNTALTGAIVNDTTSGIMSRAGFDATQTTTVLNAFRIIMAPPDAM